MSKPSLPLQWYFTLPELAQEWGCAVDRILYYLDAGLLWPCALVAKSALPTELRGGVAPRLCVILDRYLAIEWQHEDGDATASLIGEFAAFYVDREGFRTVHFTLPSPVGIRRDDLVVSLDQRERLEDETRPVRGFSRTERRTLLYIVRALAAMQADTLKQPYKTAGYVCEKATALGVKLSIETVARKLKEALSLPVSEESTPASNVGSTANASIARIAGVGS